MVPREPYESDSPQFGHDTKQADEDETSRLAFKLSILLAGGLLLLVALLNISEAPEIPVAYDRFQRLVADGEVARLVIRTGEIGCRLRAPIELIFEDRDVVSDRLVLIWSNQPPVAAEQVSYWRSQNIQVEYDDSPSSPYEAWTSAAFVGILACIGLWHLWGQIQTDRKGIGSPRRRLRELENQFREGRISLEDYERAREAIWAEM